MATHFNIIEAADPTRTTTPSKNAEVLKRLDKLEKEQEWIRHTLEQILQTQVGYVTYAGLMTPPTAIVLSTAEKVEPFTEKLQPFVEKLQPFALEESKTKRKYQMKQPDEPYATRNPNLSLDKSVELLVSNVWLHPVETLVAGRNLSCRRIQYIQSYHKVRKKNPATIGELQSRYYARSDVKKTSQPNLTTLLVYPLQLANDPQVVLPLADKASTEGKRSVVHGRASRVWNRGGLLQEHTRWGRVEPDAHETTMVCGSDAVLKLERLISPSHELGLTQLRDFDSARHGRLLQSPVGGVVDFSVDEVSDPFLVGLYYTKVKLGTIPSEFYVQIDTRSGVLWVSCTSCNCCPKTNEFQIQLSFFDPRASSSASVVSCLGMSCYSNFQTESGCAQNHLCSYTFEHGDESGNSSYYISDFMSLDTVITNTVIINSSTLAIYKPENCRSQVCSHIQSFESLAKSVYEVMAVLVGDCTIGKRVSVIGQVNRVWERGRLRDENSQWDYKGKFYKGPRVLWLMHMLKQKGLKWIMSWKLQELCHGLEKGNKRMHPLLALGDVYEKLLDWLDFDFHNKESQKKIGTEVVSRNIHIHGELKLALYHVKKFGLQTVRGKLEELFQELFAPTKAFIHLEHKLGFSRASNGWYIEWFSDVVKKKVKADDVDKVRSLLKKVFGEAKHGRLLAIMGPSGFGKTTLVNVLAGQLSSSLRLHFSGLLEVNGKQSSRKAYKLAFVRQEDLLFSQLAVRETLSFAVELQLPEISTAADWDEFIELEVIRLVLLCGNQMVLWMQVEETSDEWNITDQEVSNFCGKLGQSTQQVGLITLGNAVTALIPMISLVNSLSNRTEMEMRNRRRR